MSNDKYTSASTSNADKVIDALEEVQQEKQKPAYQCNECGGLHYTVRSPLGGPKIKICTNCGSKSYTGRASMAPLLPENLTHGQGTSRGPTKRIYKQKPDKHQPTFRSKGRKR